MYQKLLVQHQLDGVFLKSVRVLFREAMESLRAFEGEESGFTGVQIVNVDGVSLSTVRRRMARISISSQYSELSDENLD